MNEPSLKPHSLMDDAEREFQDPHYHDDDPEIQNDDVPRRSRVELPQRKRVSIPSPKRRFEDD